MAANNGPYYTPSRHANESSEPRNVFDEAPSMYPDLGLPTASNDRGCTLVDNAPQTDQTRSVRPFAGLIRAATVAAGHESTQSVLPISLTGDGLCTRRESEGTGMRRHTENQVRGNMATIRSDPNSAKRKTRRNFELQHTPSPPSEATQDVQANPTKNHTSSSASNQELQSVSALFRRTSNSSKKYTRPPMSKLFTSLELSPEGFLQLQAAAKAYMLDESYPDRRETVGQRGKGDSELVRLRLWTCVKDFLEAEGNGKRFFGRDVPGDDGAPRTMFWPTHKNSIITAVTPLLRRMVTNERQRQYAVETRKTGNSVAECLTKRRKVNHNESRMLEAKFPCDPDPCNARLTYPELFHNVYGVEPQEEIALMRRRNGPLFARIDELSLQSGLSQATLDGLVGILDYHFRIVHGCRMHEDSRCNKSCEGKLIERILGTGYLDREGYLEMPRVSSDSNNELYEMSTLTSKQLTMQSPSVLLHELFRNVTKSVGEQSSHESNDRQSPRPHDQAVLPEIDGSSFLPLTRSLNIVKPTELILEGPITLHVNLIREGKRLHGRLDIAATVSMEFSAILEHVDVRAAARKIEANLEGGKIMVMLPEGLVPVAEDDQWRVALGIVRSNDWMDSELTILIELER